MGRIAVDVSILEEPRWTGVERSAAGLVAALGTADGDEVLLYSRRPVRFRFPLGERLVPRPIGGPTPFAIWRETALVRALARDGVSLLHSPVAAIPLLTRVPRSATVHEMPWLRHPGIEGRFREARFRLRIRAAARAAALLVAPSETVARDLLSFCPAAEGKTAILPFGVEEFFRPLAGEGWREETRRRMALPAGPMVLFVGRARRKKNLPVLVDAVTRLRRAMCPAPSLVLAGVTRRDVPPGPGVWPLGFVSDGDLVRLYNLASVLAYPSLSEGFGFPPLEAMACGTPVVATSAGAVPEVAGDAALLVDPGSPADLAAAIRSAIEDAPLRDRLTERGSTRVRSYRWPAVGELAARLLDAVAA
jgi:glycosyltransferase involved in cell wall biosynthesis